MSSSLSSLCGPVTHEFQSFITVWSSNTWVPVFHHCGPVTHEFQSFISSHIASASSPMQPTHTIIHIWWLYILSCFALHGNGHNTLHIGKWLHDQMINGVSYVQHQGQLIHTCLVCDALVHCLERSARIKLFPCSFMEDARAIQWMLF